MDDACYHLLLNRYHHDRHNLLEFLLSSGAVRSRSGASVDLASVDLDSVSPDYVIHCILSGSDFDPSEATRRYFESLRFPITATSSQGKPLFFLSSPDPSGSPPHRAPPGVAAAKAADLSSNLNEVSTSENGFDDKAGERNEVSGFGNGIDDMSRKLNGVTDHENGTDYADMESYKGLHSLGTPSLNLPELTTGLDDTDMQETAYEVLLACILPTLPQSVSTTPVMPEEKKKEKKSLLMRLRSKKEGRKEDRSPPPPPEPETCYPEILNLIRSQLEISEAMDGIMKQGLRPFSQREGGEQIYVPSISLELLHSISKMDFPIQRLRTNLIKRHANILEELLLCSANTDPNVCTSLRILLNKIRSSEEWVVNSGDGRIEVLKVMQRYASTLKDLPPKFDVHEECSYYFNIRLYEKLVCSIFDVLEEGQIVEEAEDILELIKLTWSTLGITQELHHALVVWVLFNRFIETGEVLLLRHALHEIEKVTSNSRLESNRKAYVGSVLCSVEENGDKRNINLVETVVFKIRTWCHFQLEDYHLHFSQDKYSIFGDVLKFMVMSAVHYHDKFEAMKFFVPGDNPEMKMLHFFVENSILSACNRVITTISDNTGSSGTHPLALIANELKLIADKEFSKFSTILCSYYSEAGWVAFIIMHSFYGERLKPFLEEITHLSEPVKAVLSAFNNLELSLAHKLYSLYGESAESPLNKYVNPYKIPEFSSPLILQWIQAQHEKILEWTSRAVGLEDWEPLSSNKKQASSAVEVFRIAEETIEQFFSSNLPMDTIHLRFLLIGISRSLETYVLHMADEQVEKTVLYPSKPILTRYTDSTNHLIKKYIEQRVVDGLVTIKLKSLTVPKLCVKLNTLWYIRNQLDSLEVSITESWRHLQSGLSFSEYFLCISERQKFTGSKENFLASDQHINELFTVFDDVRRSSIEASEKILDFIGARAIFLDLRQSFLFSLYRGSVDQARLEIFLPQLDQVLDRICDLIIDELRDQTVSRVCRASMEGFIWILLDGGPSRAFSESDVEHMQEDLTVLKDLFIANGHGLPPDEVELESKLTQEILDLYSLKTETIIEMLMHSSQQDDEDSKTTVGAKTSKNAQTLLRVLCHKKDRSASKFLKLHYELPRSSEYDDLPERDTTSKLPSISNIFRKSKSIDWTLTRQGSLKTLRKRFQEATSEMKNKPW